MAEETEEKLNILSAKQKRELTEMGALVERSRKSLSVLRELGLGTTELESQLDWAEKRRKILLEKG